jgi:PAS domain S-box-containing protein
MSPGKAHDQTSRFHSLQWRLPLLISSLIFAVLTAFLLGAYREVKTTLVRAAGERARTAGTQIAGMLERSTDPGREQLRQVAANPEIRRYLRSNTQESQDGARAALTPLARGGPRRITLWSSSRALLLEIASPVSPTAATGPSRPLPMVTAPGQAGVTPLQATQDGVFFADSVVSVDDDEPSPDGEPLSRHLGDLLVRSTISINPPGVLSRLAGDDAGVEIGNRTGDVWTNLSQLVPGPAIDLSHDRIAQHRVDGRTQVGALTGIRGTPWVVWVAFPESVIVAPARGFLARMVALGAIFALAAAIGVRALTVRITTPLTAMTKTTDAIVHGDYSRRVPSGRRDEIGRLGDAFNTMSDVAQHAKDGLEARARESARLVEALRESEAHYRTIVDVAFDCIITIDARGIVNEFNPAAEKTFGYRREEAMGRELAELIIPPSFRERHRKGMAHYLATGEGPALGKLMELMAMRSDGTEFPADVAITAIPGDGPPRFTGFIRDITARKQAESALQESQEQLRQAQKMEAIGQLAGGVAHDFNNLLTAILGYANLLSDGLETTDTRRADVEQIQKAAHRAAGLTKQLLAFSRKQVLQPKRIDLNVLISDTCQMLRRLIGEHIQLETRLAPVPALIDADPSQIEQIIMNLAVNARDAMPFGGRLSIETANIDLDESYTLQHAVVQSGPYVMLTVSDTGTGMTDDTKRRLFEPFFTTKERGRGTGLGLPMVYGIVKQSGGYVWVYSELNRGTTFKIYLPQVERPDEIIQTTPVDAAAARGSEAVLLVEDEKAVRFPGLHPARTWRLPRLDGRESGARGQNVRAARRRGRHPDYRRDHARVDRTRTISTTRENSSLAQSPVHVRIFR